METEIIAILGGIDQILSVYNKYGILESDQIDMIETVFKKYDHQKPVGKSTISLNISADKLHEQTNNTSIDHIQYDNINPRSVKHKNSHSFISTITNQEESFHVYCNANETIINVFFIKNKEKANKIVDLLISKYVTLYFAGGEIVLLLLWIVGRLSYVLLIIWCMIGIPTIIYLLLLHSTLNWSITKRLVTGLSYCFKMLSAFKIMIAYLMIFGGKMDGLLDMMCCCILLLSISFIATIDAAKYTLSSGIKTFVTLMLIVIMSTIYCITFFFQYFPDRKVSIFSVDFSMKQAVLSGYMNLILFVGKQLYLMIKDRKTQRAISLQSRPLIVWWEKGDYGVNIVNEERKSSIQEMRKLTKLVNKKMRRNKEKEDFNYKMME